MREINLNKGETVTITASENGKHNVPIKMGNKHFLLDYSVDSGGPIDRGVYITFYKRLNKDRQKFSKYEKAAESCNIDLFFITDYFNRNEYGDPTNPDITLDREFFENAQLIAETQKILDRFRKYRVKK